MHPDVDLRLLEARCHSCVSARPPGGLPGRPPGSRGDPARGGDPDEQGDEAAGPPPAGLPVSPFASLADQHRPRRERRRDQKNEIIIPMSASPRFGTLYRSGAQLTERGTCVAGMSAPGVSLPGWMSS